MREELRESFGRHFGRAPTCAARAPGRVNLIGEHTDYNGGLVLPCAIDRETQVAAAPRSDRRVCIRSLTLDEEVQFELGALATRGGFADYAQAPFAALAWSGSELPGLDLMVWSDVPREAGLSSSAALGVALVAVISAAAKLGTVPLDWARLAHRGESEFVGVGCGIMDQFASALGQRDHALRIDCRSQEVTPVPFAAAGRALLLVAESGVRRKLAAGGYRERVDQCAAALAVAREAGIAPRGATALRDLGESQLPALERVLEPVSFRRARHVIRENARVDRFAAALEAGDLPGAGALLREGMASLRDDYEVSVPELDHLCESADALPGVYGSRLTGAGWGGCTLHLVEREAADAVERALAEAFAGRFGRRPRLHRVRPAAGAEVLEVSS